MKRDYTTKITQSIIDAIEAGATADKWQAPWHRGTAEGMPVNAITGNEYSGINVLIFGMAGLRFETNEWATFNQWKNAGTPVKKGERGTKFVYYSTFNKETGNVVNGEPEIAAIPFLKVYTAFNADQVEGREANSGREALPDLVERQAQADRFIAATGADIHHGGARAFYRPLTDEIHMPSRERFRQVGETSPTEGYYSTLLHELTHWTGAKHRLDRLNMGARFGDNAYAFEELIAELGAAFLCRKLRISTAPREDHAQYLDSWLKALKANPKYLFKAAAAAQKAVEHLDGLQAQDIAKAA